MADEFGGVASFVALGTAVVVVDVDELQVNFLFYVGR